jgi:hypothetical protein
MMTMKSRRIKRRKKFTNGSNKKRRSVQKRGKKIK